MRTLLLFAAFFVLSTSIAAATPYTKQGYPSGHYQGKKAKGWVLLVHGGGWAYAGRGWKDVAPMDADARRFQNRGWMTLSTDYRPGGGVGYADVLGVFDSLRKRVPQTTPICTYGVSAGAQYVSLLAAGRATKVACTISVAGPTDFTAYHGATPGTKLLIDFFHSAFGNSETAERFWSPISYARQIHSPLFVVSADNDPLIPKSQAIAMVKATGANAKRFLLKGTASTAATFIGHSYVTNSSAKSYYAAERKFFDSAKKRWGSFGSFNVK